MAIRPSLRSEGQYKKGHRFRARKLDLRWSRNDCAKLLLDKPDPIAERVLAFRITKRHVSVRHNKAVQSRFVFQFLSPCSTFVLAERAEDVKDDFPIF